LGNGDRLAVKEERGPQGTTSPFVFWLVGWFGWFTKRRNKIIFLMFLEQTVENERVIIVREGRGRASEPSGGLNLG
jgi:hypothetical protein